MSKSYVEINGERLLWRDVVRARQEQRRASLARKEQLALFTSLPDDTRPQAQRKAAGRYLEPTLFD